MSKKIQDNNHLYNLLSPLVQFATRCHYRHFVVRDLDNLPTDGAYIIAPCHQQALMEPLAVLCFAPKAPVFLARADIFAKPAIRAILTFLRILPVYRIRDGKSSLGKNHAIFDQSRDVLLDGYPLCLMAEGRHNNRHQLLPLGKGMFRIAGETQQRLGDYPLYIVPTGIDFDHYERPYSNLVVNIGKPIPVQPFMETYLEDEPVALNQMRDALTAALSPLMLDIRDNDRYDQIYSLCNSLNRDYRHREGLKNTAWNRFLMRQKIAADVESGKLKVESGKLKVESGKWTHLTSSILHLTFLIAIVIAAVLVPVVRWVLLFCIVCYPITFIPTHLIVKKKVADPQFRSSINFGVRLVLAILYAIVIAIVMAATGGMWMSRLADIGAWWGLVALAWVPIGARLAAPTVCLLRNAFAPIRHCLNRKK